MAMANARNGVTNISRHMKPAIPRPDARTANSLTSGGDGRLKPNVVTPPHDNGLAMPHWTTSFESNGVVYPFTVMGTNPAAGGTTSIPTVIIPYRLVYPDNTAFDASADLIDGVTPLAGVVNSPLFQPVAWSAGKTGLGVTQFGDAVMRANFWSSIPGDRSGYHVLMAQPVIAPVQTVTVPADKGYWGYDSKGARTGLVDEAWLENTVTNLTVSLGVPSQVLAIHLMSSIEGVFLNGGGSLGFHWAVFGGATASPVIQPFIQTGYFSATSDRSFAAGTRVLAHEVAEWLNDPAGDNVVPAWQDPARLHVCDSSLMEVGDPLEFVSPGIQVPLNGVNYGFPDVVFLPWFTGDHRPTSVNGWYTLLNNFSAPSAPCPVYTIFGTAAIAFNGVSSTNLNGVNNIANNTMQIVGYVTQAPNAVGGFQLDFSYTPAVAVSNVTEVYVPGSAATIPVKINDHRQIAGLYYDTGGKVHGFLLSQGQYSSIDFPGAMATEALAINNWAVPAIAGDYTDTGGKVHGFVFIAGLYFPVDAGFAVNLSVRGINDTGQIVGAYDLGGTLGTAQTFGFTGSVGGLTPLNYPGDPGNPFPVSTLPNSLNNQNKVTGEVIAQDRGLQFKRPFLEGGGNWEPIFGGTLFSAGAALGNNDFGILVGWAQIPSLGSVGGVAIPVQLVGGPLAQTSLELPLTVALHATP
jgi:hypothetical protein